MKKLFLPITLVVLIFISADLLGQVPTVAFVGITRTGSTDGFSFVLGENLNEGTIIYFTDEEYRLACDEFHFDSNCDGSLDGEPYVTYTVPMGGLTEGTVVSILETSNNTFTVAGGGTAVYGGSGNFTVASSDAFHAFAASNGSDPLNSVTEVYASIKMSGTFDGGTSAGDDPTGDYPNAIVYITGSNDLEFDPSKRGAALTRSSLLNGANWTAPTPTLQSLSITPFTGTVDLSNPAAPVTLTTFFASRKEEAILLLWQTAGEENNAYFEIERSKDGKTFAALDKLAGNGTTQETMDYEFMDRGPMAGTNYYRLRQVDYDGSFEYSPIVVALMDSKPGTLFASPNPAQDVVHLQWDWDSPAASPVWAEVHNLYGQLLSRQSLSADQQQAELSIADLTAGTYLIRLSDENGTTIGQAQRIVKL